MVQIKEVFFGAPVLRSAAHGLVRGLVCGSSVGREGLACQPLLSLRS